MSKAIVPGPNKRGKRVTRKGGIPIRCNRLTWRKKKTLKSNERYSFWHKVKVKLKEWEEVKP